MGDELTLCLCEQEKEGENGNYYLRELHLSIMLAPEGDWKLCDRKIISREQAQELVGCDIKKLYAVVFGRKDLRAYAGLPRGPYYDFTLYSSVSEAINKFAMGK